MMARVLIPWILMPLLCVFVTAARWQSQSQIQKTVSSDGTNGIGWQPMPTAAAILIHKRQPNGPNTCGYLDGNPASSLTCLSSTDTCVSNTALSVIGCCNTASAGPSSFTYTQCTFHTGCLNFADVTNVPANPLVRTCSPDYPNCQTIGYLAGTLSNLFTDFICGNTSTSRYLLTSLPSVLTSFQSLPTSTGVSTTTLLTTNTPSLTTIPSPSSLPSHGLSPGSVAGITVGSFVASLVSIFTLFWCAKRRVRTAPFVFSAHEDCGPEPQENINSDLPLMQRTANFHVMEKKNSFGLLSSPGTLTLLDYMTQFPAHNDVLLKFLKFLSIYGHDGVPLRELLMMGVLRYRVKQHHSSCPPWNSSGRIIYRGNEDDQQSFLSELVLQAQQEENLDRVEQRLVECDLIRVARPAEHNTIENSGWAIDTRIWYLCDSSLYQFPFFKGSKGNEIQRLAYLHLIEIFQQMPDKTSHPLAERHREIYYYHVHALLWQGLGRKLSRKLILHGPNQEDILHLLLKTLTHRYQQGDMLLLETARELLPKSDFHTYDWVLLQIAELKCLAYLHESCSLREPEKIKLGALMTQMKYFLEQPKTEVPASKSAEARDVAGFFLIEMMDLAQSLQDQNLLSTISNVCLGWVQETLNFVSPSSSSSSTRLKISPLSCMLVKLKKLEQVEFAAPEEFRLSYGYYASRAGHLRHAEGLLTAALGESDIEHWRYGYELITVYLRQGRWEDAGNMATELLQRHRESLRGEPFRTGKDLYEYKLTGDPGEWSLTNVCFMADRWAERQQFSRAERLLRDSLSSLKNMRDHFIRTTRVAIQLRLLNVQLKLKLPGTIMDTCQSLFSEIQSSKTFPLKPEVVESIIQELLACISRLRGAGHVMEARLILESILLPDQRVLGDKFEELYAYMYRIRAEISSELGGELGSDALRLPTATAEKSLEDEILPADSEGPQNQSTESDMIDSIVVPDDVSTSSRPFSQKIASRRPTWQTAASSQQAKPRIEKVQRSHWSPFSYRNRTLEKVKIPLSVQNMLQMRRLNELSPPRKSPETIAESQ